MNCKTKYKPLLVLCDYFYGCPRLTCSRFSLLMRNIEWKYKGMSTTCALVFSISCLLYAHTSEMMYVWCALRYNSGFPFLSENSIRIDFFCGIFFRCVAFVAPTSIAHRKIWNASTLHRMYEWNPIEFAGGTSNSIYNLLFMLELIKTNWHIDRWMAVCDALHSRGFFFVRHLRPWCSGKWKMFGNQIQFHGYGNCNPIQPSTVDRNIAKRRAIQTINFLFLFFIIKYTVLQ